MKTYQLELLQAVLATQQGLTSIQADHVHLDRGAPIGDDECDAINIVPGESRFESMGSEGTYDILKARVQFTVAHHTRGEPQVELVDPAKGESHQALMQDPSLGGLALRLFIISSRPRKAPGNGSVGVEEMTYEATVLVDERTLAIWSHET